MKRFITICLIALSLNACKHSVETPSNTALKVKGRFYANSLSELSAFNAQNAAADVVLRYSSFFTNWGSGNTSPSAIANAAFTNDSLLEAVTTASVNGVTLNFDSSSLLYSTLNNAAYTNPNAADWSVTGYEGTNFTINMSSPSSLTITSPHPGDTVSASTGFTVTYSGNNGGDLITDVTFDPSTNVAAGDSAVAANGKGYFEGTTADIGSVTVTPINLDSISNGWVDLELSHWEFDIDTLTNGKTVAARSINASNIYVYLKP